MMTCDEALAAVEADRDGELRPSQQALLQAHLARCAACRVRSEQDGRADHAISAALGRSPDPRADAAVFARALAGAGLGTSTAQALPVPRWRHWANQPPSSRMRWLALVASLALLAFFSLAGLGLRRSHPATPPPVQDGGAGVPGPTR
jgi:anti-sigma factor RsiW